jgi:hypothetical protein
VLGDAARHVEWIEKELRWMHGLLEQVGQHGDSEQGEWTEKLMDLAREAEDAIEMFVINSVKKGRWGVLYWNDKYKVGKELVHIRKKMRDISQIVMNINTNVFLELRHKKDSWLKMPSHLLMHIQSLGGFCV